MTAKMPAAARLLGTLVAPTTLISGLLYYFGWAHAYYFFNYFGVNSTVLHFSTADYLMRSVDALFIPLSAGSVMLLLALWADGFARTVMTRPGKLPGRVITVLAAVATLLAIASAVTTLLFAGDAAAPVGFTLGVLLLAYSIGMRRRFGTARKPRARPGPAAGLTELVVLLVLIGLSLFAAATDYAADVGRSRAEQELVYLRSQPGVAVYSEKDLSLHGPGVTQARCPDPQGAYRFRYDGLKLLLESGGQYLLLPSAWTPADGNAIVLPQDDSTRLEFYARPAPAERAAC
jgi:hypothetical protein